MYSRVTLVLLRIRITSASGIRSLSVVTSPRASSCPGSASSKGSEIRINMTYPFKLRTTTPLRNLGSNQVDLGGIIASASAIVISCSTLTG